MACAPGTAGGDYVSRAESDAPRVAGALLFASMLCLLATGAARAGDAVSIAVSRSPLSTPFFVADTQGYFAAEGLDVVFDETIGGHRALEKVLSGQAEFATTSDLPIMFRSFESDSYRVLSTFVTSSADSKLVLNAASGARIVADLAGARVGVVRGSSSHFFLDLMLLFNDVDPDRVEVVDLQPEQMRDALVNGEVAALSTWEPYATAAVAALGDRALVLSGADLYQITFNLVCDRAVCDRRPEVAQALLRALRQAAAFIHAEPAKARAIVSRRLGVEPAIIEAVWQHYDFGLRLEQRLVLTLEAEARWALAKPLVSSDAGLPDYLRYLEVGPLTALMPERVSVLR